MTDEWQNGFEAGYQFALNHYNPQTGTQNAPYPNAFIHREGAFNCGFGEGLITGRGVKIDEAFGKFKSIYWENGRAIVTR